MEPELEQHPYVVWLRSMNATPEFMQLHLAGNQELVNIYGAGPRALRNDFIAQYPLRGRIAAFYAWKRMNCSILSSFIVKNRFRNPGVISVSDPELAGPRF